MADKLLIAISAQGATAAHWRGGRIADCRSFANDEDGRAGFKDYLAAMREAPVHVLVDAVEEDYRFETLPHAFGRDRAELIARKLKQHYRATPYAAACLLGRDTGKRRDDRYLFCALTNPDLVGEWLQEVQARGLPVAGIHLLPMVSAALLERLDARQANLLLVVQHEGGLRLTFFRDQRFRLSRLTRADLARLESRSRFYTEEISNTRLYLHALRAMTLDEPLAVLLADPRDELAEVAVGVARDNPGLQCTRVGRAALAGRLQIAEPLLDLSPYMIYLPLLARTAPPGNLASPALRASYQRYQARRAVYAGCGALALGAAVWAGANLYQAAALRAQAEDTARQSAQVLARYLEITRQFPQAPASAQDLKRTVEIAQKLRESARTPEAMMRAVSRALEASPNIVVREFGWKYGTTEIEAEGPGRAASETPAAAPAAPALARRQSGLIEGEVRPFRGDYRAAIEAINGFAARLAKEPAVAEVRTVKLPLNVNPALSLSGNTLDNPELGGRAEFRLLLVFKPNV
ncbi:MAG TPA: hypothetical protein VNK67_14930 [Burkholderiales bacterium]|nr:hypothetical protein [Burkholderiales bacterium]